LVVEQLILFEKLSITSNEGNALQMFVDRVSKWQERFASYFLQLRRDMPNIERELLERSTTLAAYNMLPSLKRAELNDLYVDGLLMEIDTDEIKQLNAIFKERYKCGEFEQFKLKIKEISLMSASETIVILENSQDVKFKGSNQVTLIGEVSSVGAKIKAKKTAIGNGKKLNTSASGKSAKLNNDVSMDCDDEDEVVVKKEESESDEEDFCAATKCNQPTGNNIKWVRCDGSCNRWFHMHCVGISKIKKKESYLCDSCKEDKVLVSNETILTKEKKVESNTSITLVDISQELPPTPQHKITVELTV
jgi:hypothetical protein